jgi:hypothetical protein
MLEHVLYQYLPQEQEEMANIKQYRPYQLQLLYSILLF